MLTDDRGDAAGSPSGEAGGSPSGEAVAPQATTPAPLRWQRWVGAVVLVELLLLGAWLARGVGVPPEAGFMLGFACVSAAAVLVSWASPAFTPKALVWVLLPAAVLGGAALLGAGAQGLPLVLLVTATLLLGATLIGSVVGRAIEHPGQLVFVAIVGSAMDVLSVLHPSGVSAAIAESDAALSVVALAWPLLGTDAVIPLLGAGDIVFTALYVAASRQHGLSVARSLVALGAGYVVTLLSVVTLEQSLPALPFLGAAFVIAQPAARRPTAADRKSGLRIAVGVVLLVGVLLFKAQ